jgi:RNA polymerase sigma factor (sigma-70 family)
VSEAQLKALMVAGMAGDARAYHALLILSAERLRAYFGRRLIGREADVEDLVQETLVAVHRKRASYSPALPFTAWLHGIARYRLIDQLRRDGRRVSVPLDDADLAMEPHENSVLAALDVEALLAGLPSKHAAAIRLTRIEGLSTREAAERSGQSEPAVKVNVHRGLGRLIAKINGRR